MTFSAADFRVTISVPSVSKPEQLNIYHILNQVHTDRHNAEMQAEFEMYWPTLANSNTNNFI